MTSLRTADVIVDLVSLGNRLSRLAAQATGNSESPAVWRTLAVLRDHGPLRLGGIARVSRVSQPTMTKIVQALEERGWIRRIADRSDARASLLSATEVGLRELDAWREELAESLAPHFTDLDDHDVTALEHAAGILRAGLEASVAADGEAVA